MKRTLLSLLLIAGILFPSHYADAQELTGKIKISGAFALFPLAKKWSEEFKELHPGVEIEIQGGGAGKGATDALAGLVDFGMVSREITPEEIAKGANTFGVAIDAVVATYNTSNPLSSTILAKGVKKEGFASLWLTAGTVTWGQLLGIEDTTPVKVYTRSDAAGAAESWAKYLGGTHQDDLKGGVGVFGDPGVISAILKETYAIGYNNIGFVYDPKTKKLNPGVGVIPIDFNGNGKIDTEENFYGDLTSLMKAISSQQYPAPPSRLLYFVTKGEIRNPAAKAFIKWVLNEGQKYSTALGYVQPSKTVLETYRDKIN